MRSIACAAVARALSVGGYMFKADTDRMSDDLVALESSNAPDACLRCVAFSQDLAATLPSPRQGKRRKMKFRNYIPEILLAAASCAPIYIGAENLSEATQWSAELAQISAVANQTFHDKETIADYENMRGFCSTKGVSCIVFGGALLSLASLSAVRMRKEEKLKDKVE